MCRAIAATISCTPCSSATCRWISAFSASRASARQPYLRARACVGVCACACAQVCVCVRARRCVCARGRQAAVLLHAREIGVGAHRRDNLHAHRHDALVPCLCAGVRHWRGMVECGRMG
jgi:hypothetical protein